MGPCSSKFRPPNILSGAAGTGTAGTGTAGTGTGAAGCTGGGIATGGGASTCAAGYVSSPMLSSSESYTVGTGSTPCEQTV